jgi:Ca2+-binding RTX toxin-like protein
MGTRPPRLRTAMVGVAALAAGFVAVTPIHAAAGARPACTITGTAKDDRLHGTNQAEVICAGDGDDEVRALGGDDVVFVGAGADYVIGGRGDDRIVGGPVQDLTAAGPGNDVVRGGGGSDVDQDGEAGDDSVFGGPGRDDVRGGIGQDRIVGGRGNDVCLSAMDGARGTSCSVAEEMTSEMKTPATSSTASSR